jgi:hypothetical protein
MTTEINFIKGIGFGLQYEDELVDEYGNPVFVVILELGIIRILFFSGDNIVQ